MSFALMSSAVAVLLSELVLVLVWLLLILLVLSLLLGALEDGTGVGSSSCMLKITNAHDNTLSSLGHKYQVAQRSQAIRKLRLFQILFDRSPMELCSWSSIIFLSAHSHGHLTLHKYRPFNGVSYISNAAGCIPYVP